VVNSPPDSLSPGDLVHVAEQSPPQEESVANTSPIE
jgi:hypothetical protein